MKDCSGLDGWFIARYGFLILWLHLPVEMKIYAKKSNKMINKNYSQVVMYQQNWAGFWQAKLLRKFFKCLDPIALQVQESLGPSIVRSWNFSSWFYYDHALSMHLPCLTSRLRFSYESTLIVPCLLRILTYQPHAVHVLCYCTKLFRLNTAFQRCNRKFMFC